MRWENARQRAKLQGPKEVPDCSATAAGAEGYRMPSGLPTAVCRAVGGFYDGEPAGKIARAPDGGHAPKQRTASGRIGRHSAMLGFLAVSPDPRIRDKRRSDMALITVRDRQRCLHAAIGSFTRFWTACTIVPNKAAGGVSCLLGAHRRQNSAAAGHRRRRTARRGAEFRFRKDKRQAYRLRCVHARGDITGGFNRTMRGTSVRRCWKAGASAAASARARSARRPRGGRHHGERAGRLFGAQVGSRKSGWRRSCACGPRQRGAPPRGRAVFHDRPVRSKIRGHARGPHMPQPAQNARSLGLRAPAVRLQLTRICRNLKKPAKA